MSNWRKFVTAVAMRQFHQSAGAIDPKTPPSELRARFDKIGKRMGKVPTDVTVAPVKAGLVPGEWVEPADNRPHRIILYFHGGHFVFGSPDSHRGLVARLAKAAKARALLTKYRLAPEFPFPAALEDALESYRWLIRGGNDPRGIVLVGDGSGGNLAIAAAMALRDAKLPMPAAVVAMSPWTDLAFGGASLLNAKSSDRILSVESLMYASRLYLNGEIPTNPLAAPLYGNFKTLPPLLLHAGALEILRDDAVRTAQKAERDGVDVSVEVFDGVGHLFQAFPLLTEAQASLHRISSFIQMRTERAPMPLKEPQRKVREAG
jgi:acetyl esterase/lipase